MGAAQRVGDTLQLIWTTESELTVVTVAPDLIYAHGKVHLLVDDFLAVQL